MASVLRRSSTAAGIHITQDMHYKMSKKIAQLTKVIYALHTKNDENELLLSIERRTHEEELQRLTKETQARIESYRHSVSRDAEYRVKLEALQASVAEHERLHETAITEFREFQTGVSRRELALKEKHADELKQTRDALSDIKSQFAERLAQFEDIETSRLRANSNEMKRLKEQHKQDIDSLSASWLSKVNDLEIEKQRFRRRAEVAEEEKQRGIDEAIRKERELKTKALEKTSTEWKAEVERCKDRMEKMREEFEAAREAFGREADEWKGKHATLEEEMVGMRREMEGQSVDSSARVKEVVALKSEKEAQKLMNNELRSQLATLQAKFEQQLADMHNKAGEVGRLLAQCHSLERRLEALQQELNKSQQLSKLLEEENRTLVSTQSKNKNQLQDKTRELEKDLQRVDQEKRELKTRYAQELEAMQVTNEHKETEIRQELLAELSKLKKQHEGELAALQERLEARLVAQREEGEKEVVEEGKKCQLKIEELEEGWRRVESEGKKKLQVVEMEVERLRKRVRDKEAGLGSVSEEMGVLRGELDGVRVELSEKKERVEELEVLVERRGAEMEGARKEHMKTLEDVKMRSRVERDALVQQMQNQWTDRLKDEMSDLRQQLSTQHTEENRQAMERLSQLKDNELDTLRREMTEQLTELQRQLGDTEKALEDARMAAKEHENQVTKLQVAQGMERQQLENKYQQALKDLDKEFFAVHQEELQQERQANSIAVETVRDEARKEQEQMLDKQRQLLLSEMDELRLQLERDHQASIDQLSTRHQAEVQRVETLNKQLVSDIQQQVASHTAALEQLSQQHKQEIDRIESDNKEAIRKQLEQQRATADQQRHVLADRDSTIVSLVDKVGKLEDETSQLRHELEEKGQEVLAVRREGNAEMKRLENHLRKEHEQDVTLMAQDHDQQIALHVNQFVRDKMSLQQQIAELQSKLHVVQQLYDSRESRPEDLEMIKDLEAIVDEKDESMRRLEEQKRLFQLELVNREENFNRIFKASPKVGVIDPLQGKKKQQSRQFDGRSLSPSTAARLAPLTGSPMRGRDLRRAKPLPDPFLTDRATKPEGRAAAL